MPPNQQQTRPEDLTTTPAFSIINTTDVEESERFDYWRQLFIAPHIDKDETTSPNDFLGEMRASARYDGVFFANLRADPIVCNFGGRDSGLVLLGPIRGGALNLTHGRDERITLSAKDGLLLFDCDKPAISSSTRYDLSYLALPRDLVIAAIGGDPAPRGTALRRLPDDGMSRILLAHLNALSAYGETLTELEVAVAIKAATDMAVALLSRFRQTRENDRERLDSALVAAAQRYIDTHFAQHDLTSDTVAAALGCSRAHLYRAFTRRDQTIAGYLRGVRLNRAGLLLRSRPNEDIGVIAFDCGYTDLSAFGKAFKRHFGVSPSEYRDAASPEGTGKFDAPPASRSNVHSCAA